MLSYEWDEGEPLSARGDDSTGQLTERRNHTLLRPIYINAVEVGYAYTQCDKDKRLNVRGVTIALWYFISKGHQTVAMLPYCFKTYPDKSSSWPELMALFKMNLIEFTPGYGSEKYTEVNRILANRAADTGGCIVARSQMHNIIEERPTLDRTVEKRLLMPSFNHNDIIFPVDGPLGRCGPSLRSTLECPLSDPDWPRCSAQQMVLRDQRHWLTRLCALVPDQVAWRTLLHAVMTFKPSMPLPPVKLPPRCLTHAHRRVYPPETNPIDGKGYSYARGLTRRYSYEPSDAVSGLNRGTEWRSPRPTALGGRRFVREVHRRYETDHAPSTYRQHESRILGSGDSDKRLDEFLPEYLRPPKDPFEEEPRFADSATLPNYLGNPNSIYRLRPHKSGSFGSSENSTGSSSSSNRYNGYFKSSATSTEKATDTEKTRTAEEKIIKSKTTSDEQTLDPLNPVYSTEYVGYSATSDWPAEVELTNEEKCAIKLSQIFGWRKAVRVVKNHPRVRIVSRLVDFALVEADEDDDDKPGEDVISYTDLVNMLKGSNSPVPSPLEADQGNLIDFSEDVLISTASPSTLNTNMAETTTPQPLSLLDM
ncbi:unnamed protein product [Cylicocyclus nassatus]|uniref:RNase NYN domain-containing protein n=1 Tax=Cylicocyclus nassatus TaxID=53992 RepID=A0AA36M125_CYLNA|nr:unnamed protein product [Cylicocyclus nassatus]